jgi:hypothetical protein
MGDAVSMSRTVICTSRSAGGSAVGVGATVGDSVGVDLQEATSHRASKSTVHLDVMAKGRRFIGVYAPLIEMLMPSVSRHTSTVGLYLGGDYTIG